MLDLGKMVSIYLTDKEADDLKRFCEDNNCTQYSAVKTAIRELLVRSINGTSEESNGNQSNNSKESNSEITNKDKQSKNKARADDAYRKLMDYLSSK